MPGIQEAPLPLDLDLLERPFAEAEKPRDQFRIGTEVEKFGFIKKSGTPLPATGPVSVASVLDRMARDFGWVPKRETEGGPIIALLKNDASITLEPGGQVELSGAPLLTLAETLAELKEHQKELAAIGESLGVSFLGLGFHPFATLDDLPRIEKLRYGIMREYLPTRGSRGLDMMYRTSTVQANLDFLSEADAMAKLRVSIRLQPLVTALFANSPYFEGRHKGASQRAKVWLDVDPDRSGLLPFIWDEKEHRYRHYIDWALKAPMFMVKRGDRIVHNTGQVFADFLANGHQDKDGLDTRATMEDWVTHLNTLFPEVRLKRTIEMRGADAHNAEESAALSAFWKGLCYSDTAFRKAEQLAHRYSLAEMNDARVDIGDAALRVKLRGKALAEWCEELIEIATLGIDELEPAAKGMLAAPKQWAATAVTAGEQLAMSVKVPTFDALSVRAAY